MYSNTTYNIYKFEIFNSSHILITITHFNNLMKLNNSIIAPVF